MRAEKVTVVIPAYRATKTIGKVLESLSSQDYPDYEIIVVDDAPFDPCGNVVKKFKKALYAPNEKNMGLSRSINKGIRMSKGSVVVTLHDDCVPLGNKWLSNLVKPLHEKDVVVSTSDVLIDYEKLTPVNKIFSYVYGLGKDKKLAKKKGQEDIRHIGDKCDAYKKEYLKKIGGFDETYREAGEDTDISNKIIKDGKRIVMAYDAQVEHIFSETERQASIKTHMKKATQLTGQTIHSFLRYGTNYKLDMMLMIIFSVLSLFFGYIVLLIALIPTVLMSRLFFAYHAIAFAVLHYIALPYLIAPLSYLVLKNGFRVLKYVIQQRSIALAVPIFIFGMVWDILAGYGWMRGILIFLRQKIVGN